MNSDKSRVKLGAWERIKSLADIPGEVGNGFYLQMRGEHQLIVSGCRRILEYSPQRIRLAIKGFSLIICGEGLVCSSYFERAVGIEGIICCIQLDFGQNNSKRGDL